MQLKTWLLLSLFSGLLHCQTANCNIPGTGSGVWTGANSVQYSNVGNQCSQWRFTYNSQGFSGLTFEVDGAQDNNGVPGTFSAIATTGACTVTGTNPSTLTTSAVIQLTNCYYPWIQIKLSGITGTGSLEYRAYGSGSSGSASTGAGGSGTITFNSQNLLATYNNGGGGLFTFGPVYAGAVPPSSGWSWFNQGAASINVVGGMLNMNAPSISGDQLRLYARTIPSTPFTLTAMIVPSMTGATTGTCGIAFYESSTGKTVELSYHYNASSVPFIAMTRWTNLTTFGATIGSVGKNQYSPIILSLFDDGSSIVGSYMPDGVNAYQIGSVAVTTGFTTAPNNEAMMMDNNASGVSNSCTIFSWVD